MALNENIMIRLSADTSNYSTRMAAASTQAEKLSTALEKPGSKSRIATNLMAGMGLAAIALGVSATKLAADFDQSRFAGAGRRHAEAARRRHPGGRRHHLQRE